MGIMVYSLLWVVQDFVHQPNQHADYTRRRCYMNRHAQTYSNTQDSAVVTQVTRILIAPIKVHVTFLTKSHDALLGFDFNSPQNYPNYGSIVNNKGNSKLSQTDGEYIPINDIPYRSL